MTESIRQIMIARMKTLRQHPYNGEFAFGSKPGQIPEDETFEDYSDQELVDAFERVCRAAYKQR